MNRTLLPVVVLIGTSILPLRDAVIKGPRFEGIQVAIKPDGAITLNREPATLDELKAEAAMHPDRSFYIDAVETTPHVKVAAADALRGAGTSNFSARKIGTATARRWYGYRVVT